MNAIQHIHSARKLWNDCLNMVLEELNIKYYTSDYGVYIWEYKGDILILNLSTNNILVASHYKARATPGCFNVLRVVSEVLVLTVTSLVTVI